jgi:hypothetical protein
MQQIIREEVADVMVESIGVMVAEDREALIDILKRNGVMISDSPSDEELLDVSLKALKDSINFRKDIQDYLVDSVENAEDETSNFVNGKGGTSKVGTWLKGAFGKKEGGSAVGNFFRNSLFTKENLSAAVGLGLGYAGTRLQSNAQKSSNQQAIDFEKAKAEAAMAEAKRLETEGLLAQMGFGKEGGGGADGGKKKWILPVAIIGGVAVVGTILYFVLRKRQ